MRKLNKLNEPNELRDMKSYWERKVKEVGSDYYKTKYRSKPIKLQLKRETHNKCVYCESKIGHNTPGDVEHKIPVSIVEEKRFNWNNLTIACNECNRRKNDYYDENTTFIDPYIDDVENILIHAGPVVFQKPGCELAEISIRILELAEIEKRTELFGQKVMKLKSVNNLMERIIAVKNIHLKKLLIDELNAMADVSSEYSAMIKAHVQNNGGPWANQANAADAKGRAAD